MHEYSSVDVFHVYISKHGKKVVLRRIKRLERGGRFIADLLVMFYSNMTEREFHLNIKMRG